MTEAATLSSDELRLLLLGPQNPKLPSGVRLMPSPYKLASEARIACIPCGSVTAFRHAVGLLAPAHRAFLERQSATAFNPGSRRGHDDGLVRDLARASGIDLELPARTRFETPFLYPEEKTLDYEGARKSIEINKYERSARLRAQCLRHYGYACAVCEVLLSEIYGPQGAYVIHVHHEAPLAQGGRRRRVDAIRDLKPVCPNCHAVIHTETPPLSIHEVRRLLKAAK